ncbi:MAG: CapA family protein [Eubacteriales bacterium]|jgi:poly-gamma-glutamate synthesis protein (capsule biosynthesis protein)|nr:CapA family protein [Eubacteriales bacterium]
MSLEIFIGAGVDPSAANTEAFSSGTQSLLCSGLNAVWKAADARIFSLESPLSDSASCEPSTCNGNCVPVGCASGVAALSPTGVSLCTEGIACCGADGINATRAALKAKQVAFFGAGEDIDAADQSFFFVRHGVHVGVYAVCERESAGATERRAGANPLDLVNLSDRVREIKSNCDRLIVLYHGGREGYPFPTPMEQKVCRKIAECGASLVLSQGSHAVGCSERWNNTTIVYGQGSFICAAADSGAQTGLLVRYAIGDYGADTVGYVPIVSTDCGAALADETKAAEMLDGFQKRTLRVRVEGFVPARFQASVPVSV